MKLLTALGLAALTVLTTTSIVVSPVMAAEQISPCELGLEEKCTTLSHVHATTLSGVKGKLLSIVINVECDVLFLGEVVWPESAVGFFLAIEGDFTYSNCNGGCAVTELSEASVLVARKLGEEAGSVIGEGEVNVHCGFFINCVFDGHGLLGTAKAPEFSTETNGEVSLSGQEMQEVSGFCPPEPAVLDITVTPLGAIHF